MNDYMQYIGLIGFAILCLYQVKLWCNIYHSCGVMWDGLKGLFKKRGVTEDQRIGLGLVKDGE